MLDWSELDTELSALDLRVRSTLSSHPELLADSPPASSDQACYHCYELHEVELACMERLMVILDGQSPCIQSILQASETSSGTHLGGFSIREVNGTDEEDLAKSRARLTIIKLVILASRHLPDAYLPIFPCGSSPLSSQCASSASKLISTLGPQHSDLQALTLPLLDEMAPMMRKAVKASLPNHEFTSPNLKKDEDEGKPVLSLSSNSTFDRFLFSRSLSRIVRSLDKHAITSSLSILLPAIIILLDDPSPFVKANGCWALHHLAVTATSADLMWQKELLLDLSYRLILGSDRFTWASSIQASVSLVAALEGNDPRSNGYHKLMTDLLIESERSIYIENKRLPFLLFIRPLIQALGLTILRHLSRLLPLVLESLHSYDVESQLAAVLLLFDVIKYSWARISTHLPLILSHLDTVDKGLKVEKISKSPQIVDTQRSADQVASSIKELREYIKYVQSI